MQLVGILSKVSYTCHQLQLVRHSSPTLLPHLNISAASHLSEILLLLQGFVNLVICHAEAAQSGLNGIVGLGKYDKLGHIWDTDDLSVHLSGEIDRFLDLSTVYQPESRKQNRWGSERTSELRSLLAESLEHSNAYSCATTDAVFVTLQTHWW